MKIISKFKDYYDFISHQYGQDPLVVYERRSLSNDQIFIPRKRLSDRALNAIYPVRLKRGSYRRNKWQPSPAQHTDTVTLVAGKYVFPILRRHDPVTGVVTSHEIMAQATHGALVETGWRFDKRVDPLLPAYEPPEEVVEEVIRAAGMPVFAVHNVEMQTVVLAERVPILAEWGVPALIPASEMWQNISHLLSNVLRRSPDKEPPCTVNNAERIQAAGFDEKTSFRHPVKWPRSVG